MVSSNVAWRQETLARLEENVRVAEQRMKHVTTFIEGLDTWEEWHTARRCLQRYLEEIISDRVAAS